MQRQWTCQPNSFHVYEDLGKKPTQAPEIGLGIPGSQELEHGREGNEAFLGLLDSSKSKDTTGGGLELGPVEQRVQGRSPSCPVLKVVPK